VLRGDAEGFHGSEAWSGQRARTVQVTNSISVFPRSRRSADSIGSFLQRHWAALFATVAGFIVLYWATLRGLVEDWSEDPDLSHGFLIPVVSATILFANRKTLGSLPARKSLFGLFVLLCSLAIFFTGILSFTNILQRLAIWGTAVGALWFVLGPAIFRSQPFPFLYLLMAIPLPFFLISPLRIALKSFATRLSADALSFLGYSAQSQGSILVMGEHHLEVADACSGVRSLLATLSTAFLFCYLFRTGYAKGTLLVLTTVPVTIVVNMIRILVVAVALVSFDLNLTSGMTHEVIGLLVFCFGAVLLYLSWRGYNWFFLWKPTEGKT